MGLASAWVGWPLAAFATAMFKFLRKYNKFLLAGFGSLLLVVWLVPSAITEFSRQTGASNATLATLSDGSTLTAGQAQQLQRQVKLLSLLQVPLMQGVGEDEAPATWWLLVREASQAGLIGGPGQGQKVLEEVAAGIPPQQMLQQLCSAAALQPREVLQTLADLQGVSRLLTVAAAAARLSDARIEAKAAEAMTSVSADVVVLGALQPLPRDEPVPTPERMQALLGEFAAVEPGAGRGGMGYRQPDRVALEWFTIPAAAVRASLENDPQLEGLALRKAFLRDPQSYGAPASDAKPNFDAFRDRVRAKELDRLTAERMEAIAKFVADHTQLSLRNLPKQGVYAQLPADDTGVLTLAALSADLAGQFGVAAPAVETTGLITLTEVRALPGVGSASTNRFGNQPMRLEEVVRQARELKPETVRAIVQQGVVGPALQSASAGGVAGDLFVFRITQAVPAHDARDMAEVQDLLMADTARVMRFETLTSMQEAITAQAKADLTALASEFGTTVSFAPAIREADAQMLGFGLRVPTALPGLKPDEALSRDIVRQAMALPADVASVPEADRTFVIPSPANMALVAVRVQGVSPLTREDFVAMSANPRFRDIVANDLQGSGLNDTFKPEALKARHGFKPARQAGSADSESPAG